MKRKSLDALWDVTRGQRLRFGAAIAAQALSVLCLFAIPLLVGDAIDALHPTGGVEPGSLEPGSLEPGAAADAGRLDGLRRALGAEDARAWLIRAGTLIVLLTVLAGAFLYVRSRLAATAAEATVRRLRDRLYRHLHELPCAWHDAANTGDVVQRCSSDVETVRTFLAAQVVEIGRSLLLLAALVPALVFLNGRLAVIGLALMPAIFGLSAVYFRRIQRTFRALDEAEGRLSTVLQENLTGIRVVRAFARQEFEIERFGRASGAFRDRGRTFVRTLAEFWAASDLLCLAQVGLVVLVGAHSLHSGAITVGTYVAFVHYLGMAIWPIRHAGRILMDTGRALVALERIGALLWAEPERATRAEHAAIAGPRLTGAIEIRGLTFAYGDEPPALSDVDLDIAPGETLALVGPPGSGKSTVVALLLGLYDYRQGSIRLDGLELSGLDRRSVRAQIAAVLQEPFLYSQTVGQNLRLARPRAPERDVRSAARAAALDDAIAGFDGGYEALVGERGVTLSGGQRQRLALARALVARAPVLVLDDALSAVDSRTEARILERLARRGRRTTLVVSHRLSTVRRADRIAVLDAGRVVESGTHAELLELGGEYRRLWDLQTRARETYVRAQPVGGRS